MNVASQSEAYRNFLSHVMDPSDARALILISKNIDDAIDLELTKQSRQICINDGFSPELDSAKLRFDELDDLLSRVGITIAQRAPELGPLQVIFLPQVGFLVVISKADNDGSPDQFCVPSDFVFTFEEESKLYFKSAEMYTLDDQEGDLDALIKDTEAMIAAELEESIIEYDLSLRKTFHSLAELDCILAFANAASELSFTKPEVVDNENIVIVEDGRNPLQEIVTEHKYISNDVLITSSNPIAVITGANFSGKVS